MYTKKLLAAVMTLTLLFSLSYMAMAVGPEGNSSTTWGEMKKGNALLAPSKGNVKLKSHIFIDGQTSGDSGPAFTDQFPVYKLFRDGVKWSKTPVKYKVNLAGAPAGAALAAIIESAETWDDSTGTELFEYLETTALIVDPNKFYGINTLSWASFDDLGLPSDAVAVCVVWFWVMESPSGKTTGRVLALAEFHIINNSDQDWAVDAPDVEGNQFDVQNVDVHEFGHTLFEDDLYMPPASELTMYGYVGWDETKKRTLGLGDKLGLWKLYGE